MNKKNKPNKLLEQEIEYIKVETMSFRRRANDKGSAIAMGIGTAFVFAIFIIMLVGTIIELIKGEPSEFYIGCIVIGVIAVPLVVVYIVFHIRPFFLYEYLCFVNTDKKYAVTKNHKGHVFFYTIGEYSGKCYAYIDGTVITHEYKDSNNKEGFQYFVDGLRKNLPKKDKKNGYRVSFENEYANLKKTNPIYYQLAAPGEIRKDFYTYQLDDNLKPLYCKAVYRGKANAYLSCYNRKDGISFNADKVTKLVNTDVTFKYYRYEVIDFNSDSFAIELPSDLFTVLLKDNVLSQDEKYVKLGKSQ